MQSGNLLYTPKKIINIITAKINLFISFGGLALGTNGIH